jgi:hypothetical protein
MMTPSREDLVDVQKLHALHDSMRTRGVRITLADHVYMRTGCRVLPDDERLRRAIPTIKNVVEHSLSGVTIKSSRMQQVGKKLELIIRRGLAPTSVDEGGAFPDVPEIDERLTGGLPVAAELKTVSEGKEDEPGRTFYAGRHPRVEHDTYIIGIQVVMKQTRKGSYVPVAIRIANLHSLLHDVVVEVNASNRDFQKLTPYVEESL